MQTKSIQKLISAKLNEWITSITDTQLRLDVRKALLVSGGSIASLYLGEQVNDYDIYFTDRKTLLDITNYYAKAFEGQIKVLDGHKREDYIDEYRGEYSMAEFLARPGHKASALRNLKEEQIKIYVKRGGGFLVPEPENKPEVALKYQPVYFSPNAISLSDDIQIVIRFHGTPEEIHKTFDFIHATNYFTVAKGVVTNKEALESLLTKQLKYQGSFFPLTSIIRAKKFVKRGFNINAGELLKMMFQTSLLDLQDMDVLEEQLIGVDVAYFEDLINALRKYQEGDPEFKITPEFFNGLIDKIFNSTEED